MTAHNSPAIAQKLDPRLRLLKDQNVTERSRTAEALRLGAVTRVDSQPQRVEVLIRVRKAAGTKQPRTVEKKLTDLGVDVRSLTDGPDIVVTGTVAIDQLEALLEEEWIDLVEASQRLYPELDRSGADVGVRPLQTVPPTVRGTNVLVGVIDGGIDFRHDDFRHPDGTTRIRFIWDQTAASVPNGTVAFGREYTKADIDAALRTQPAPVPIPHSDPGGHGTHVAGIAAGNGRRSNGGFMGMAPEAELVVVAVRGDAGTLGESGSAAAAFRYVVERAKSLGRPVSINMSLGTNGGGHSGESPLETAMDNHARQPGVVIVKSAGNEQTWRIHARGRVAAGETVVRRFESSGNNSEDDMLEVWFDSADRIGVAVQAPGAPAPGPNDFVLPGASNRFTTPAQNSVRVDALVTNASGTGDVRVVIFLRRGNAPRIQPGRWAIHLRGDQIADGEFHAWIERVARDNGGVEQSRFVTADADPTATISIPGTARRVITAGSYVTRFDDDAAVGELSRFSSRGPTRYGLRKPEIAAPGESIASALSSTSDDSPFQPGYTLMPGTSMAAPHVAGVAALVLQVKGDLNCDQVKQVLGRAARRDGAAAAAPDDSWGGGRLSAGRAVELARGVRFPVVTSAAVNGTRVSWKTDVPTTGAVRFNTNPRRMLLGRAAGSRASLTVGTDHAIDLHDLPAGAAGTTYHCEILAFTPAPEEWYTIADDDGQLFPVHVPPPPPPGGG